MQVQSPGKPARLNELPIGTCIVYARQGVRYIGVTFQLDQGKPQSAALWSDGSGFVPTDHGWGGASEDDYVFACPDAVASFDLSEVRSARGADSVKRWLPGTLVLGPASPRVIIRNRDQDLMLIDLETGAWSFEEASAELFTVPRWKISIGERVLCIIECRDPGAMANLGRDIGKAYQP